jgi:hypothetical protein
VCASRRIAENRFVPLYGGNSHFQGHRFLRILRSVAVAALALPSLLSADAIVSFDLTNQGTLGRTDDGYAGPIPLNLDGANGIDLFGAGATSVFVNNNGNVTFSGSLSQYTPTSLANGVGQAIIAPFFADVDTRSPQSGEVTYGNAVYNGFSAFVVEWPAVGYFNVEYDKLNTFQLILIDRSDTGPGNFDIEFNYDTVQWDTGDASGGYDGLGGTSAAVGYSNGLSGSSNVFLQLPGSLVNGALLDNGPDALIANSANSEVAGRYDFAIRNRTAVSAAPTPEPSSLALFGIGLAGLWCACRRP